MAKTNFAFLTRAWLTEVMKAKQKNKALFFPGSEDTICALATPPGEGALSLIRMSGPKAFSIARQLCPFLPAKITSHRIYFGRIRHPQDQKVLDEALVLCFKKGRSWTGEESVEFSCHGGLFVANLVLSALTSAGARLAERGEFSFRAFMNGRMDLIQAEGVLSLIQSRSPKSQQQALKALGGKLSQKLQQMETNLLKLLSHIEASIDFSEEDISPFDEEEQKNRLKEIKQQATQLIRGFKQGLINREGFSVLLVGAPNAGKSSLFNQLLEADQAIVTTEPGTTRDILSSRFVWQGREFCLKDSAGLRAHPDPVEKEGIKKTEEEIKKVDLSLFLLESQLPLKAEKLFGLEKLNPKTNLICFSKADLLPNPKDRDTLLHNTLSFLNQHNRGHGFFAPLWLSARTGEGMDRLKALCFERSEVEQGEIFLSTPRQESSLKKLSLCLNRAERLLNQKASPDLIAFELKEGLSVLHQLSGRTCHEDVIQEIFKEFCLGK